MTGCAAPRHDGQDEPPYRVLVTGSRDWQDREVIAGVLMEICMDHHSHRVIVIHGAARGADEFADEAAHEFWMATEPHPADWNTHGKRAGFIRNAQMVALGADICLAFIRNGSRGATHCAGLAEKAGIPVRRFTS